MATKFRARKVPLNRGGCTRSGRYYGTGQPLYEVYEVGGDVEAVVRARSNKAAVQKVKVDVLRARHAARSSHAHQRMYRYLGGGSADRGYEKHIQAVQKHEWAKFKRWKAGDRHLTLTSSRDREAVLRKQIARRRRKTTKTRRRR